MKKSLVSIALLLAAASAQADVINTVGLTQIAPPSVTVQSNFLADNGLPSQVIWAEQQDVLLLRPLRTDTGVIPAGTVVDSYFFALNTDNEIQNVFASTSVTFDGAVLGLVYLQDADYNASPNYRRTDFLGAPNVTYNETACNSYLPSGGACGFETFQPQGPPFGTFDTASFAGNTAIFGNDFYSIPGDFARILVAQPVGVPGPIVGAGLPGLLMACGGLVAFARRRRRLA